MKKMIKIMLLVVGVICATFAAGDPCHDDKTCFDGFFCDKMSEYVCRPCLQCTDLRREQPALTTDCVKSVTQCGVCLKEFVESHAGELKCVPRAEDDLASSGSTYMTWVICAVLFTIFLALLAVLLACWIRKPDILKMYFSTAIGGTLPTHGAPTAPESPPPYSPHHWADQPRPGEGTELPLIKTYQPPFPAQESQEHERAGVFNPPVYVRLPNSQPAAQESHNDVNGNYSPGGGDEDTTPSPWVPTSDNTHGGERGVEGGGEGGSPAAGALAAGLSAALAAARDTHLIQPGSHRLQQESNQQDEAHSQQHEGGAAPRPSGNGNYNIMNVNVTFVKPNEGLFY